MIEILEHAQQYVPISQGRLDTVFLGGDQLICERIRGAKVARRQCSTRKGQLQGLCQKIEDWHALQAYYEIIWDELYSTKAARDKCTSYQFRNLIDRRDVTANPKGKLNECQSFLTVVLEAEILTALTASLQLSLLQDMDISKILEPGGRCIQSSVWLRRCYLSFPSITHLVNHHYS